MAHVQDRNLRRSFSDAVAAGEFQNGWLLKSKTIPLSGLEPGDYRLVVSLRAEGSAEVLASLNVAFKLEEERPLPGLYFLSNARALPSGGVPAYVRALEAMGLQNDEKAAAYLKQSLDRNPSNPFAIRVLVRIYFTAGKYDRVGELYNRFGIAPFSGAPETLAQDRKSTRLNSSHIQKSRMPSSA